MNQKALETALNVVFVLLNWALKLLPLWMASVAASEGNVAKTVLWMGLAVCFAVDDLAAKLRDLYVLHEWAFNQEEDEPEDPKIGFGA